MNGTIQAPRKRPETSSPCTLACIHVGCNQCVDCYGNTCVIDPAPLPAPRKVHLEWAHSLLWQHSLNWSCPQGAHQQWIINSNQRAGEGGRCFTTPDSRPLAMAASVYSEETRSTTSGGTIPLASQHDRLLIELESAEGQLGAIVRYSF